MSEGGGCLCGATRFEVRADPRWVAHCHCLSCRRATGAPVTTYLGVAANDIQMIRDSRRQFASSPGVLRGFCAECGSPISYQSDRYPGEVHIHLSAMDAPQRFPPQSHVYVIERIEWLELHDALPRYDGPAGRGARPSGYGPLAARGHSDRC